VASVSASQRSISRASGADGHHVERLAREQLARSRRRQRLDEQVAHLVHLANRSRTRRSAGARAAPSRRR
jgi:hypothetical protein